MTNLEQQAPFLQIKDLTVDARIGEGDRSTFLNILRNLSLDLPSVGYSLGLVGESGSGKTTLAMALLNGIEWPITVTKGSIKYFGKDILQIKPHELREYRWKTVSLVPQGSMNSLNPVKKVTDALVEIMRERLGFRKSQAMRTALSLLDQVGFPSDRIDTYPFQLSGGMRQRLMVALALTLSPKLLIADEPTSALDIISQKEVLSLMKKEIKQREMSLIYITHDISVLTGMVDNVAVMYRGEIVEIGTLNQVLFSAKHPYTEMLLSSLLSIESSSRGIDDTLALEKYKPSVSIKNACSYSNRCKFAFDRCGNEKPELLPVGEGRSVACHKYN